MDSEIDVLVEGDKEGGGLYVVLYVKVKNVISCALKYNWRKLDLRIT